mmetsp:Transcript_17995/g.32316  ORF Transcript_17995/g.32316 Transcript_17995/m.32316 type:complete len:191 (-) Transcript_17995:38-610(-)
MESSPTKPLAKVIEKRMLELTRAKLSHLTSNDTLKKRVEELKTDIRALDTQKSQKADQLVQTERRIAELEHANQRLRILKPFALMLTADQTSDLGDPTLKLLQLILDHLTVLKKLLKQETAANEALEQQVTRQAQHRKELEAQLRTIRPYDTLIHNFLKVLIAPKLKAVAEGGSPDTKLSFAQKLKLKPS